MTVALETIRSLRAVTPQNTIIEAQHVGQRFTADNGTELTVFDNISFNLYEGEIVGELDPKKTTVEELGLYMAGAKKEAKKQ